MKVYLAGTPGIISREREWQKILTKRLLSYWDISQKTFAVKEAFELIKEKHELIYGRRSRWWYKRDV